MESNEQQNFCTHCGHFLQQGERFCPECGTRVPGANPEEVAREKAELKEAVGKQLRWASILMLVYSLPFLAIGVVFLFGADAVTDYVTSTDTFASYVDYYGLTADEVHSYVQYSSVAFLASGLCGVGSAVLCWKRTKYWAAVLLCVVSVFAGSTGFVSLFLGLLAFWMIVASKPAFREYEGKLDDALSRIF
ncbi:MAG: zinc-ribbon domain-containing protein [Thermoplasmata archaeon]|nr:zinc-ribbon domain-containing protein [Thermoplasmata archaeon]